MNYLHFPAIIIFLFMIISCGNQTATKNGTIHEENIDSAYYYSGGDEITMAAFDTLSKTLQKAIAEQGPAEAIDFCKTRAIPITSSVATNDVIRIKRTAIRYRNPDNAPDELEKRYLENYLKNIREGEEAVSKLFSGGGTVHFFKPIKLMPLCVTCHGKKDEIPAEVMSRIKQSYPDDQATGFSPGDLRGIWHIEFRRKQ